MPVVMPTIAVFLALLRSVTIMPHQDLTAIGLPEIVNSWESIVKQCGDASIQFVTKEDNGVTTGTWLRRGRCRLVRAEVTESSGRYLSEVFAENEDYSFRVARTDRTRPWTLLSFVPRSNDHEGSSISSVLVVNDAAIGQIPIAVNVACVLDVIKSPAVTVDSITHTPEHHVLLAFHFNDGQEKAARDLRLMVREGVLTLDPERGFAVVGYDLVKRDGTHMLLETVSVPALEGSPISAAFRCGTRVFSYQEPSGKRKEMSRTEVVACELGKHVPLEEFRLSAFGLPEPGEILVDQRGQMWWWIGSGGLVIVLTGLWVYRRQRAA